MMAVTTVRHRRQKSHIICLTKFPHTERTERVWNKQKTVEEMMLSFSVNDLCKVLSIMNHNGHFCVTTVWLFALFNCPGLEKPRNWNLGMTAELK